MWLVQSSEGSKLLCTKLEDVSKIILTAPSLVWTIEHIVVWTPPATNTPEIVVDTQTGQVKDKIQRFTPVPLNRSGDLE